MALKRLVAYSAKNRFYRANRDLGRIFKTEFILQYLSEPELRGRIRRGLLKVEQLHALARDVFYGRRGRINARELWEQMNTCSCLTLILACIVYWQAREISRVLSAVRPSRQRNRSLLARTRQPHRVGQRRAVRPIHPRSEARPPPPQGHDGGRLACKITRICPVPLLERYKQFEFARHNPTNRAGAFWKAYRKIRGAIDSTIDGFETSVLWTNLWRMDYEGGPVHTHGDVKMDVWNAQKNVFEGTLHTPSGWGHLLRRTE